MLLAGRTHNHIGADFLFRASSALHPTGLEATTNRWPNGWVCQAVRAPVAGTVQFRPVHSEQYGPKRNLVTGKSGLFPSISSLETGNPADAERFLPMLDHHIAHYGAPRRQIAADGGYASRDNLDEPGEVVWGCRRHHRETIRSRFRARARRGRNR
jgi:hypothetical protein